MTLNVSKLGDEEAQRVLVELFDLLPGADKPAYDEMASMLGDLRDSAAPELKRTLDRLDDHAELKGAFARQALIGLAAHPDLAPLVDQATERAKRTHMSALPELIAGVLVVLAVIPTQIETRRGHKIQWNQLAEPGQSARATG